MTSAPRRTKTAITAVAVSQENAQESFLKSKLKN
jgi:hypothetical protein